MNKSMSATASQRIPANQLEPEEPDDWFELAMQSRERIRRALDGRPMPSIDQVFHDMREERDQQLLAHLTRGLEGADDEKDR